MQNGNTARADIVNTVLDVVRTRLEPDRATAVSDFVTRLLDNVPLDDLLVEETDSLFGNAVSLWEFAKVREPGTPKIRVHNPNFEEHGWHCEHTVVEIITDDAPFLVDSVTAALSRTGTVVHLAVHPILWSIRDADGVMEGLADTGSRSGTGAIRESVMQFQITQQTDARVLKSLEDTVTDTLEHVRLAVRDWQVMRERCTALADDLEQPGPVSAEEAAEVREFLYWLREDHYTFLGYREYDIDPDAEKVTLTRGQGLGILADSKTTVFDRLRDLSKLPDGVGDYLSQPKLLFVNKSSHRSPVHRPVHMDVVAIRRFDETGRLTGLAVFVGLFTLDVYTNSPAGVPVLRSKIAHVLDAAGYDPGGHDGKRMMNILENLPRDELFQTPTLTLMETAQGILHLQERRRCAIYVRVDQFHRFVSALVYIPRDRYETNLRKRIETAIEDAYHGEAVDYYTQVSDSPLARVQFIVKIGPDATLDVDIKALERQIADLSRSWGDHLQEVMVKAFGEEAGLRRFHTYGDAFPTNYVETFPTDAAIKDIAQIDAVLDADRLGLSLYHPVGSDANQIRFKIYHADHAVPLSDILPMLENTGFRVIGEIPYEIRPKNLGRPVWIHDFQMTTVDGADIDIGALRARFEDAFIRIWDGEVENDGFNKLVVAAGLDWREVVVVRAYARYLRQIGYTFSQDYITEVLIANPRITRLLVDLFRAQFDPELTGHDKNASVLEQAVLGDLEQVVNADEDRILRSYLDLIRNSLRTNFFQAQGDGSPKPYLSFKLDSRALAELPLPRPMVEIFVYSPRVEGIHLRGGRVARGGLRWSDRREDFRTEILGLMKAQMVKNAVIVPVGSKGGFVVKQPPADPSREAQLTEGIACYRTFICGLLDLTDNLDGDVVVPPEAVVRRDVDDPYLVVAADKGTATFSDIANDISLSYGFWLGDAFASGGSNGYDHKAMGITARGAWESVKRHFHEMSRHTQTEDFTVVGVGDMSGDVFGNGMLLSEHIKLVAAFNHMHIFLDPDPDPAASFAERKRLFDLPRSTWADYSADLISRGGGVYERKAKVVHLTPEIKAMLGLSADNIPPNELIKAILKAEVDLLWFGGIGTYLKAAEESNADAGDRANDAVRINAAQVRAKVIGEGANLAVTQRARIEYALKGGRINTDAIDNSAGVDCSDHEVNIKILLNGLVTAGDMTEKQRNSLLADMTDEVSGLVLRHNYLQTQAISMVQARGVAVLDQQDRLMRLLEKSGRLNRDIEFLPDDEVIADRFTSRRGLTRAEIAVLIPYSKLWLFDEILDSDLPDEELLIAELVRYFPTPLRAPYRDAILKHRLRREIIATVTTNSIINRVGGTFITQMMERTGLSAPDVARSYLIAREAFGLRDVWAEITGTDGNVSAPAQTAMLMETNRLIDRAVLWLLRTGPHPLELTGTIDRLGSGVSALWANLDSVLTDDTKALLDGHAQDFMDQGVPDDLAHRVASLIVLASAFDVVRIAEKRNLPVQEVAPTYFAIGTRFGLGWLRAAAEKIGEGSHWQKLAVGAVIEEFYNHQRELADAVLCKDCASRAADDLIGEWIRDHSQVVDRADQLISELQAAAEVDLAMLTVASRQFRAMTQG